MNWVLITLLVLSGCATTSLGVLPIEPPLSFGSADPCKDFLAFSEYTQKLQTAYAARSGQNRGWSYVSAGTSAAGSVGAAGLALGVSPTGAAPTVSQIALLGLATTLLSSLFAIVDNPELSSLYANATNGLGDALDSALPLFLDKKDPDACIHANVALHHVVNQVNKNLLIGRTDSAAAGLQRAAAQSAHFQSVLAESAQSAPTSVTPSLMSPQDATLSRLEALVERMEAHERNNP